MEKKEKKIFMQFEIEVVYDACENDVHEMRNNYIIVTKLF